MSTIYAFTVFDDKGNEVPLEKYRGKVILIVNVASKCGFTPQYDELEEIYQEYHDQGLEILGFPCNQFKGQEPGTNEEIQAFCRLNYGVTFPVLSKINVNGSDADPLYQYLTDKANGYGGKITWNFEKFLIDKHGNIAGRSLPITKPKKLIPKIKKLLAE